jgi:APA family basic amino acid/polyamine antiporter
MSGDSSSPSRSRSGVLTATSIVVASMVGTGVFTSLGFQAAVIPSPFPLLMLWVVGGVAAASGALCYAELAAALPRSGGEYNFLSRIYHPSAGFASGWISLTVGFAAPEALAAMAFGRYLSRVLGLPEETARWIAIGAVVAISAVHLAGVRVGGWFQNGFTWAKVTLILVFSACGLFLAGSQPIRIVPAASDLPLVFSAPFAVSLVFVMYAYSGWNGSAYIAGEVADPQRTIPRSLFLGTAIVTFLFLLLNFVFLRTAPISELAGKVEVGFVSALHIFSSGGARIMGLLISLGLVSSISAMAWAGPRGAQVIGEDLRFFAPLARRNRAGAPAVAILLQLGIVLFLLATSTFEAVLTYLGFTLTLSTAFTVAGVIVLRRREPALPRPYRTWGYPFTPLLFLAVNGWMLVYVLMNKPVESLSGLVTVVAGLGVYFLAVKKGLAEAS